MKVVFYSEINEVVEVFENIQNPSIEGNNIEWETGALKGNNLPFLLLDDSVPLDKVVTSEIIGLDKKGQFLTMQEQLNQKDQQIKSMENQLAQTNRDFQEFMDFFFNQ